MKWDFRSVFNIPVNIEIYDDINVLGQVKRMKVGSGYFLLRNVNCALIDTGIVRMLSAKDTVISLETHIEWINDKYIIFEDDLKNILFSSGTYYIKKGVGYYYNQDNWICDPSFTGGEIIRNALFTQNWEQKLHEKGVYGDSNSGETSVAYMGFAITSWYISDNGGKSYHFPKEIHYKFGKNLAMFKSTDVDNYTISTAGYVPVDVAAADYIGTTFTQKVIPSNKYYTLYDIIGNRVVDTLDLRANTVFDVYFYNDVVDVYWKNDYYTGETVEVRGFNSASNFTNATIDSVEEIGFNLFSYSWDNNHFTTTKTALKSLANFISDPIIALSSQGVGMKPSEQDFFAGWGAIKVTDNGVSLVGYNTDAQNIVIKIHEKGELPPDSKAGSDDEKNDENDVKGDTPESGNIPTTEKEVGLNLLTTTYILSDTQLKEIGNELWSANFMDNILMLSNSPIENILSCKIFPTTFNGAVSAVKIGNVTMLNGATAKKISATGLSKETGSITFPQKYNSFLDFAPFTNAKIFIPFVGFQPLPVADFIGAQLSLRYVFDVVTGAVTVYILRNGAVFDKYSGICAVDVPITASNRAQVEVGQIQSAITAGAQLATGNIGGALSAGLAIATTPNHFNTRGNAGGYTSQFDPRKPYLIIDRPKAQSEITSYGKTNGFPCNLTKTLNTLSGFTSVHDVHLDDVPCLESERQELKAIMQKGFVI